LNPALQRRSSKYNEPHQKKSGGEAHKKCHEKSGNMWTDHHVRKNQVLLVENKIIADEKKKNVKNSIYTATNCISVCCLVKKSFEKRIKKIKCIFNQ
jgi:hypothetical protein